LIYLTSDIYKTSIWKVNPVSLPEV